MRGRSVSMETMSRGGTSLPTSLSGGGLAHIGAEVRSKVNEEVFAEFCEHQDLLQVCFVGFFVVAVQRQISREAAFRNIPTSAERRQPNRETQPEEVGLSVRFGGFTWASLVLS